MEKKPTIEASTYSSPANLKQARELFGANRLRYNFLNLRFFLTRSKGVAATKAHAQE